MSRLLSYASKLRPLSCRFGLATARSEDVFGVTVRLLASLENEVARRLEGDTVETWRHRLVQRIALVLAVHHQGHALERIHHLLVGDDALMQPVRQMLARNAQGRAVFHQADVVNVRHLRTADTLIDPAND